MRPEGSNATCGAGAGPAGSGATCGLGRGLLCPGNWAKLRAEIGEEEELQRKMRGLDKFLDEWEAEHGAFTEEELSRAARKLGLPWPPEENAHEGLGSRRGRADRDRSGRSRLMRTICGDCARRRGTRRR